jgi:glutamate dehydrogenase
MHTHIEESAQERKDFFAQLNKLISNHTHEEQANLLFKFLKYYFRLVALDDLKNKNLEDLYGSILSYWNFIALKDEDKTYVRVYNPQYEKHGWHSSHTIIEIVHPDLPFVVDSVSRAAAKLDLTVHLMITPGGIKLHRDTDGNVIDIECSDFNKGANPNNECLVYMEVDKQHEKKDLRKIEGYIQEILSDVRLVVHDWPHMREQAINLISELKGVNSKYDNNKVNEVKDFITWLSNDHFTFIGCCDYLFVKDNDKDTESLQFVEKSGYGYLSKASRFKLAECFIGLPIDTKAFTTRDDIIVITKSSLHSTVHRSSYLDYIAVKLFGPDGRILGERRFLGLYTAIAYNSSIVSIPLIRKKIDNVFLSANLSPSTHAGKNLLHILETLPRDDLFQANAEEIFNITMSILHMQERKQVRLFMRKDIYNRFYSCLVYLPKELFTSSRRKRIGEILLKDLHGDEISFTTQFSESILARVHFIIRLPIDKKIEMVDSVESVKDIEAKIIDCCRGWQDDLQQALIEEVGEEKANYYYQRYSDAFPASYIEQYSARKAVFDIEQIEKVINNQQIAMSLYRPLEEVSGNVRLKLFNYGKPMPLSEVLPVLENMGFSVQSENSNKILLSNNVFKNIVADEQGIQCYINDFVMCHQAGNIINVDKIAENFQSCFLSVWQGYAESDKFNQLIIDANLTWREAAVLRAYSKYFRQIGFTFSETYIQETVLKNADIVKDLIALFKARFSPELAENYNVEDRQEESIAKQEEIKNRILESLDKITNLDEDRIIRKFLDIILATLRTNYFQTDTNDNGNYKSYISFKFDPSLIPDLVLPLPMFEIFVYSPRVEGVHLRGGKVARGGLRWSDRREDFRTEVLGLMKAQQVKNAVIVPAGAKGGFVCKHLPESNRDKIMQEVKSCYSTFIKGLLDITDNLDNGTVIPPLNVVRHDEDDTYLVVAADKGTATFSDIANGIAKEYNFWLSDAFASGGSAGYDHKKIGITARGAWESVKRHFKEFNINVQTTDFTVVGIGDMSGDVFGNGMLLSRHIKLIAAFNHMHIFLDPDPDSEISFNERQRLFNLERSTWQDYNSKIISKGGGVYSRHVKAITLSSEIKKALGIDPKIESIIPNELIKKILTAPVDLLWNGGIGTYVKSKEETDSQVSDRANDGVRVNGGDLRCSVIGEGGNLGFTQLGRVEAALNKRLSFTDFIDNAGGVNCSDHEVNIKILLNALVKNGDMTIKQRNVLLEQMEEKVAELVLRDNYDQSYAITLASTRAARTLDEHARFITELEREGLLNRELEFLPNDEQLIERKAHGVGLTRPEIAILIAYSKIILKRELLVSNLPDEDEYIFALEAAFPEVLKEQYLPAMLNHYLRREIVATQLSNSIINSMGVTYVKRLFDETGASTPDIVKGHIIASEIFEKSNIYKNLIEHSDKLDVNVQNELLFNYIRLIRRSVRWLLRNHRSGLDVKKHIDYYKPLIHELWTILPEIIDGNEKENIEARKNEYIEAGLEPRLANKMAYINLLYSAMDIIYMACNYNFTIENAAKVYYALGNLLELSWFREQISAHPVDDNWDALARAGSRDDVDLYQREIALGILKSKDLAEELDAKLEQWVEVCSQLIQRWKVMILDLKTTKSKEFTIFAVALRELLDLAQVTQHFLSVNNKE